MYSLSLCLLFCSIVCAIELQSLHWKIAENVPTTKMLETKSYAIVTATFTEDIFFHLPLDACSSYNMENRPRGPLQFIPCARTDAGDLVEPACIDEPVSSRNLVNFKVDPNTTWGIVFGVRSDQDSPSTPTLDYECKGVPFSADSKFDILPIINKKPLFFARKFGAHDIFTILVNSQPQFDIKNVKSTIGSNAINGPLSKIYYSCGNVCPSGTTWTGKVFVRSTDKNIVIFPGPDAIDIIDVYKYVPIQFGWKDQLRNSMSCSDTNSPIVCLPPTRDPLDDYLDLQTGIPFNPVPSRNQIVTAVELSNTNLLSGITTTVTPKYFLKDPNLVVNFHPLLGGSDGTPMRYFSSNESSSGCYGSKVPVIYDYYGRPGTIQSLPSENLTKSTVLLEPEPLVCNYSEFTKISTALDSVMSTSPMLTLRQIPELIWNIGRLTSRDEWIACNYYTEEVLFTVNDPCANPVNGSVDICCYPDLAPNVCCSNPPIKTASVNSDIANSDCLTSACTVNSITQYANNMLLNPTTASLNLLQDPILPSNPLLPCFGITYGIPCYSDSDCTEFKAALPASSPFINSSIFGNTCVVSPYTMLYSYCGIPCVMDSDCAYGYKCTVTSTISGSKIMKSCSVSDFTLGVNDNGTQILVNCLSETMWSVDPFARTYFMQDLSFPESKEAFTESLFNFLTFQTCNTNDAFYGTAQQNIAQSECEAISLCELPCSLLFVYEFAYRPGLHECDCPTIGEQACCAPYNYSITGVLCESVLSADNCPGRCIGNSSLDNTTCGQNLRCQINENVICADCTAEECASKGSCDDDYGCVVNCSTPLVTNTPIGCVSPYYTDEISCITNASGVWVPKASTKEECQTKLQRCRELSSTAGSSIILGNSFNNFFIFSSKNESQCTLCGGSIVSLYTWTPAQMVSYTQWQPEIKVTAVSPSPLRARWVTLFNYSMFTDKWISARKIQISNIVEGFFGDRYGNKQEMVKFISCNCASEGTCQTSSNSTADEIIALLQNSFRPCPGSPSDYLTSGAILRVKTSFYTNTLDCITVKISSVPLGQFFSYTPIPFSAHVSLSPPSQKYLNQTEFIKNAKDIVIGKVISDPIQFSPVNDKGTHILSGATYCVKIISRKSSSNTDNNNSSNISVDNELGITDANGKLVLSVYQQGTFTVLPSDTHSTESINGQDYLCIFYEQIPQTVFLSNTNGSSVVLAVAIVFDRYDSLTYYNMFTPSQYGVIFTGITLFAILLFMALFLLIMHLYKGNFNLVVVILITMVTFTANRLAFFVLIFFGIFNTMEYLMVLFSELPALMFFSMMSLMIIKWAEIHHFTMINRNSTGVFGALQPVVIGVNITMYLFVGALIALYYSLPVQIETYSCSLVEQTLISRDIVALVYKCLFFVVCSVMAVCYPIYAYKLASSLIFTAGKADKAKSSFVQTLTFLSALSSVGLFLQSIILIYQTVVALVEFPYDMVIVSVCIFIAEILPTIALMWTTRQTASRSVSTRAKTTAGTGLQSGKSSDGKVGSEIGDAAL